jgi:hypothetical protein
MVPRMKMLCISPNRMLLPESIQAIHETYLLVRLRRHLLKWLGCLKTKKIILEKTSLFHTHGCILFPEKKGDKMQHASVSNSETRKSVRHAQ